MARCMVLQANIFRSDAAIRRAIHDIFDVFDGIRELLSLKVESL